MSDLTPLEAIDKSMTKWEYMYAGDGIDFGSDNCSLCKKYQSRRGRGTLCQDCPVKLNGEYCFEFESIYNQWRSYIDDRDVPKVFDKTSRKLALNIWEFLLELYIKELEKEVKDAA